MIQRPRRCAQYREVECVWRTDFNSKHALTSREVMTGEKYVRLTGYREGIAATLRD